MSKKMVLNWEDGLILCILKRWTRGLTKEGIIKELFPGLNAENVPEQEKTICEKVVEKELEKLIRWNLIEKLENVYL